MDSKLLERQLEEVEEVSGSGTSLVSLYVSSGSNISSVSRRMSQEISEADNIKSDSNRKNVKNAISKVNDILSRYKQTPDNGLVIFAGVSNDGLVEYVFDSLPDELNHSDYTCDNEFHTEALREFIAPKHRIALLVVERGGAAVGELRGTNITVHYDNNSNIMGKHNAGGQSAERFDRLIEEQRDNYFKKLNKKLKELFVNENNQPTVDGIVIGGTQITVDNFVSDGYLPQALENIRIGGSYGIDIANSESLERLVEKSRDVIQSVAEQEERDAMSSFFKALHDNSDQEATYGMDNIDKALEYGAVNKLLISDDKDRDFIQEYEEKVENQGGELVLISDDFSEGEQFTKGFNGLGALLRYQID